MANRSFLEDLTQYRVKVERDGKEIVNVPGILALPAALIAPKMSIVGTVAASLLGCNIHLENEEGKEVNVGKEIKKVADTVADAAKETAKSIRGEIGKAWDALSADDPEGCPEGEENEPADGAATEAPAGEEPAEEDDAPAIHVNPEDRTEL